MAFHFLTAADAVHLRDASVEIVSPTGTVQIALIHDGVFCVRASPEANASFDDMPSSYALDPAYRPSPVRPLVERLEDHVMLTGNGFRASVSLNPVRLAFEDSDGTRIAEDELGIGRLGLRFNVWKRASPHDRFYGLGEKAFGIDRTGRFFTNWNTDAPGYGKESDPLYKSIPFFIVLTTASDGNRTAYGIFFDNTHRSYFDFGGQARGRYSFGAEGGEVVYYVIQGPLVQDVIRRYTVLTGRTPLPPLWSLGYHQSRWSYYPDSDVRLLVDTFRARRIPLDAVHLDIHHMDGYRVFTWHPQRFPDPERLLADIREQGVRTIIIVDPGIKADRDYQVCADGLDAGAFLRYPDGTLYEGCVWPGTCYFPDFTSPSARTWFGERCAEAFRSGVAGIWTDMNEPSNHSGRALPDHVVHDLDGRGGTHLEAHNVYGLLMARSVFEAAGRVRPDERPFVLTRAAFAGIQRYASAWTGDNVSSWEHLKLTLPMLLSLGVSGVPFVGSDVGGFFGRPSAELFVRWMQLGAFQPLFRNHTIRDSQRQEPWSFGEEAEAAARRAIELRYRLLPVLYTLFHEHSHTGMPVMRPLLAHYQEDPRVLDLEDEFLFGESLLVAPILRKGSRARTVYLPAGSWFAFGSSIRHVGPVDLHVAAPLHEIPLFVRAGSAVPLAPVLQHTDERPVQRLTLQIYPGTGTSRWYEDDGRSLAYRDGAFQLHTFDMRQPSEDEIHVSQHIDGTFTSPTRAFEVVVPGRFRMVEARVDGQTVPCAAERDGVKLETPADFRELQLRLTGDSSNGN